VALFLETILKQTRTMFTKQIMKIYFTVFLALVSFVAQAQREHHADLSFGFGQNNSSISGNVVKNFKLLKSEKLHLGFGARAGFTFASGTQSFTTAPAKHTKNKTGIDTLLVDKPHFITANLTLNASYHFTSKWAIGANVDLAGLTFGKKRTADFYPSALSQSEGPRRTAMMDSTTVKTMRSNFYFTGDRNKGTLYSELFIRYTPTERYSIKAGYNFIISEYTTTTRVGYKDNYRFRNSYGQFIIGFGYNFI
jgi:hypothetical protein